MSVSDPRTAVPHPKGAQAKVLLTSVFGPFARDDDYGSRAINPMELYHNQVTRLQGAYSPRVFHRSWGILLIQENISAPCTVLDFPARERFIAEIRRHRYDVIGISSIIVNVGKVREMCRLIRHHSPQSAIVVGGHVAAIPGVEHMIDADHIVKGDGVSWMRQYLGEDPAAPLRHPAIRSGFGHRVMGLPIPEKMGQTAATIIPSAGCPKGCNFCTTSAFFGGKGKFLNFIETGDELFDVMCDVEKRLGVDSFFLMDENFLLYHRRAMKLLERMEAAGKSWILYVFSSADALRKYTMEELVRLGISWVWMGLESPRSGYDKLAGTDTLELTQKLRCHGIKTLGSTIVGMEHHTPEILREEIEHAIAHETDFHQFMLYTPVPGTALYREMAEQGRLLDVDLADIHGQYQFNFHHKAISREESKRLLDWAFLRDFERNGPSLYRICRTTLEGWRRYKAHPDERIRKRFHAEVAAVKNVYGGILWAMEQRLKRTNEAVSRKIRELRGELSAEFGPTLKLRTAMVGPLLWWTAAREERRLARGWTYEPRTFVDRRNWAGNES